MWRQSLMGCAALALTDADPPPMAGPLPVLVDGWRFDQFVLV
jgi:hypothetical protein